MIYLDSSSDEEAKEAKNSLNEFFVQSEEEDAVKDKVQKDLDELKKVMVQGKNKGNYKRFEKTDSPENASLEKLLKERQAVQKELLKITDDYRDMLNEERSRERKVQKKLGVPKKLLMAVEAPNKKQLEESYNKKVYEFKLKHPAHFQNPKLVQ